MQTPVVTLFAFIREIQNDTHRETVMQQGNHVRISGSVTWSPKKMDKISDIFGLQKNQHIPPSPTTASRKHLEGLVRLKVNHSYRWG